MNIHLYILFFILFIGILDIVTNDLPIIVFINILSDYCLYIHNVQRIDIIHLSFKNITLQYITVLFFYVKSF